ncbi:AraC family transcriptional regulator [Niabella insulamsoli]|uniref:AraC family transcriptional regulator n=1 Tax=Niabella insulamsoli TaxID=3144874 RepID=UPI0031FCD570
MDYTMVEEKSSTLVSDFAMKNFRIKDGFSGELQINIPREIVINKLRKKQFLGNLFITHIGFFPKAKFHFRERPFGCADNILIYCAEGKGHYQTEQAEHTLLPGQFFMLPPGQFHMYQADLKNPWSIYWIHFSGDMLKTFNHLIKADDFVAPTKVKNEIKIIEQWSDIYSALSAGFEQSNLTYANLSLYKLLATFVCPIEFIKPLADEDPISRSIAYMKANIHLPLTVQELAARQNLSGSHFMIRFKSKTGTSPIDYLIRLKIQFACQLLKQTDLRVNEVAEKTGYQDVFYFSRIFKKYTGVPPTKFRHTAPRRS